MGNCSECKHATVVYIEAPCYECVMGFKDAFEQKNTMIWNKRNNANKTMP